MLLQSFVALSALAAAVAANGSIVAPGIREVRHRAPFYLD